jgi:ZIP family zinc transporter
MAIDPAEAALAIGIPAAAMVFGVVGGAWMRPGPRMRSGCQHLAAGIIFAAVATELVPVMVKDPTWVALLGGFAAGVALMLGIRVLTSGEERGDSPRMGMIAGLGVDLGVDGLLVALALGAGEVGGLVLAGGVCFETLFLGLVLAATCRGKMRWLVGSTIGLTVALLLGGLLGFVLLGQLTGPWRLALLSFGAAALLYLVTEELLVEAHEGDGETTIGSALFFVGFAATLAIAAAA